jgi:hypothetical protein
MDDADFHPDIGITCAAPTLDAAQDSHPGRPESDIARGGLSASMFRFMIWSAAPARLSWIWATASQGTGPLADAGCAHRAPSAE